MRARLLLIPVVFVGGGALLADAADDAAAEASLKNGKCLTCHAVDRKKEGPAFRDVAAKYKGKPDAEAKVAAQLTSSPKIKIDGEEVEHPKLKARDAAEVKNTAQWILSR